MCRKEVPSRHFAVSEDGNTTIFSIFMLVIVIALTGASVDLMRMEANRAQLQGTLDRAVLAASDLDQSQDPSDVVADYLTKAGLGHTLTDLDVTNGLNSRGALAAGSTQMDTVFLRMSGIDTLDIPALAEANETVSTIEVSLVLDVSSSMNSADRIGKAKAAATSFVEKVLDEERTGVTSLNLVPYGGHVNPGEAYFEYVGGVRNPLYDPSETTVKTPPPGQVMSITMPEVLALAHVLPATPTNITNMVLYFDTDDDGTYEVSHMFEGFATNATAQLSNYVAAASVHAMAQDSALFSPDQLLGVSILEQNQKVEYYQIRGDQNGIDPEIGPLANYGWHRGDNFQVSTLDISALAGLFQMPAPFSGATPANMNGVCIRLEDDAFSTLAMPTGTTALPTFDRWGSLHEKWNWGWCPSEHSAIQYYSNDREVLSEAIDDMRMNGGTGTDIAVKYGLSLLSPTNGHVIDHMISQGEVEARFAGRPMAWDAEDNEKYLLLMSDGGTTMQYEPSDPYDIRNVNKNITGRETQIVTRTAARANLLEQCQLAKDNGVVVFTVAFETGGWAASDLLACASSSAHHFHVEGDEIFTAFDTVARQINSLRLTQ